MMSLFHQLTEEKIVAIFRGFDPDVATEAADRLVTAGIRFMEVTMNTSGAEQLIRSWRDRYEGRAWIGAGTVLDVASARQALAAGAQFLISPNVDIDMIHYAKEHVDVWPGAMTPSEVLQAWNAGATAIKLFPAASLGISYLKEIRAPLDHIPLIATGGIGVHNLKEYLDVGVAGVGVGSQLVNKKLMENGDFDQLEQIARQFVEIVRQHRQH